MAIAFRQVASNTAAATTVVVNVPSGTANGDGMLLFLGCATDTVVITTPSGWTLERTQTDSTNGQKIACFSRIASSEPANYTVTVSPAEDMWAAIISFSGTHASVLVDGISGSNVAGATTMTSQSITPTQANCMIVCAFSADSNTDHRPMAADSSPAATEALEVYQSGNSVNGHIQYFLQGAAAAVALDTVWTSAPPSGAMNIMVALIPAGGAVNGTKTVDTFTRANQTGLGTPSGGGSWGTDWAGTAFASADIVSNQAKNPGSAATFRSNYHSEVLPANCYAGCTVAATANLVVVAILTANAGSSSKVGYEIDWDMTTGGWGLYQLNGGSEPSISTGTTAFPGSGTLLRLRLTATDVIAEYSTNAGASWTTLTSVANTANRSANGRGAFTVAGGVAIDDFFVGPVLISGGGGSTFDKFGLAAIGP